MTTPDIERLEAMLTRLKLTAIRERLDSLLDEAAPRKLTLRETIAHLCEQEVGHMEQRRIQMGPGIARFPFVRTLEDFGFSAQPAVDLGQIRELACGRWIANGDALLLLDLPEVGKSHLAVALGREAVKTGYSVLFTTATGLVTQLVQAHASGDREERLRHFAKPKAGLIKPDSIHGEWVAVGHVASFLLATIRVARVMTGLLMNVVIPSGVA